MDLFGFIRYMGVHSRTVSYLIGNQQVVLTPKWLGYTMHSRIVRLSFPARVLYRGDLYQVSTARQGLAILHDRHRHRYAKMES